MTQIAFKAINCKKNSSYTFEFNLLSTGLILSGLDPGESYSPHSLPSILFSTKFRELLGSCYAVLKNRAVSPAKSRSSNGYQQPNPLVARTQGRDRASPVPHPAGDGDVTLSEPGRLRRALGHESACRLRVPFSCFSSHLPAGGAGWIGCFGGVGERMSPSTFLCF